MTGAQQGQLGVSVGLTRSPNCQGKRDKGKGGGPGWVDWGLSRGRWGSQGQAAAGAVPAALPFSLENHSLPGAARRRAGACEDTAPPRGRTRTEPRPWRFRPRLRPRRADPHGGVVRPSPGVPRFQVTPSTTWEVATEVCDFPAGEVEVLAGREAGREEGVCVPTCMRGRSSGGRLSWAFN